MTRITTFVIVAWRKFKKKLILAKTKRGEKVSDGSLLRDLNFPPPKFVSYSTISTNNDQKMKSAKVSLCELFKVDNIVATADLSKKNLKVEISI